MSLSPPHLVLASASPRRRQLLEQLGLTLRVLPVDLDESPRPAERPRDYVQRVAAEKCDAAVARLAGENLTTAVLAADTTVIVDQDILGKPGSPDQAAAMLRRLSGRRHEVVTAYQIRRGNLHMERAVATTVAFRLVDAGEVDAYVASREWEGKAGGYAIQGIAALFCTELRGSLTNVVGLPLAEVIADLRAAGALPSYPPAAFGARGE